MAISGFVAVWSRDSGEELSHDERRLSVGVGHERGVDVERGGRFGVAEPSQDGAEIDARREESGGDVVAEVVVVPTSAQP